MFFTRCIIISSGVLVIPRSEWPLFSSTFLSCKINDCSSSQYLLLGACVMSKVDHWISHVEDISALTSFIPVRLLSTPLPCPSLINHQTRSSTLSFQFIASKSLSSPSRLTNVSVVRLKKGGKRFEVNPFVFNPGLKLESLYVDCML